MLSFTQFLTEDAVVNAAGSGAVAGIGVGPQGEPGIKKRAKLLTRLMPKKILNTMTAENHKVKVYTPTKFGMTAAEKRKEDAEVKAKHTEQDYNSDYVYPYQRYDLSRPATKATRTGWKKGKLIPQVSESLFQRKEYSMKSKPWIMPGRTLELSKLENKALRQFPGSPAQQETQQQIKALRKRLHLDESLETESGPGELRVEEPVERSKFAGKDVFHVPSEYFHKARFGKSKYAHYRHYVGTDPVGQTIRDFGNRHYGKPIIIQDQSTGVMSFLRYGKGR